MGKRRRSELAGSGGGKMKLVVLNQRNLAANERKDRKEKPIFSCVLSSFAAKESM